LNPLDTIRIPIEGDLISFEHYFREAVRSRVPMLDRIMNYIIGRKGKQIRPMLVLLSAQMLGAINQRTFRAAALIELLHTATLVHDDVVDNSFLRRGFFSINALWKNKAAVLIGDYLLSKGLLLSLENGDFDLLTIVSKAVKELSEGELLQMEKSRGLNFVEDIYYEIINKKTASLLRAACGTGAQSVIQDSDKVAKLTLIGEKIGMAFQIKDDILDYGTTRIGKPTAQDIRDQKLTLPLIHVLHKATERDKKNIVKLIRAAAKDKSKVYPVIQYVKDCGGIHYAIEVMNRYRNEAIALLHQLPESASRDSFEQLIHYVVDREY